MVGLQQAMERGATEAAQAAVRAAAELAAARQQGAEEARAAREEGAAAVAAARAEAAAAAEAARQREAAARVVAALLCGAVAEAEAEAAAARRGAAWRANQVVGVGGVHGAGDARALGLGLQELDEGLRRESISFGASFAFQAPLFLSSRSVGPTACSSRAPVAAIE